MPGAHCTCRSLLVGAFGNAWQRPTSMTVPSFLLPTISVKHAASFTSSAPLQKRRRKPQVDKNPWRGVSALRHTGIKPSKIRLSVGLEDLQQPVLDPKQRSEVEVDEDHGLWGFFNKDRTALWLPGDLAAHGRAWALPELRKKSWEDLHALWWICLKDRNQTATHVHERRRLGNMYGEEEENDRVKEVRKTMRAIRHVLLERYYTWENARIAAMEDPEINMYANVAAGEKAYLLAPDPAAGAQTEADTPENTQTKADTPQPPNSDTGLPPPDAPRPASEARV